MRNALPIALCLLVLPAAAVAAGGGRGAAACAEARDPGLCRTLISMIAAAGKLCGEIADIDPREEGTWQVDCRLGGDRMSYTVVRSADGSFFTVR